MKKAKSIAFLIFSASVVFGQIEDKTISSGACTVSLETHDGAFAGDLYVTKKGQAEAVFSWDNYIGPVQVFQVDSIVKIDCFTYLADFAGDSLFYKKIKILTATVDLNTCFFQRNIITDSAYLTKKPGELFADFPKICKNFKKNTPILAGRDNYDAIDFYEYQLTYAVLMGHREGLEVFWKYRHELGIPSRDRRNDILLERVFSLPFPIDAANKKGATFLVNWIKY